VLARFSTHVQTGSVTHIFSSTTFKLPRSLGLSNQGRGKNNPPPHLGLSLNKRLYLTSTFHLGFPNLYQGKFHFYILEKLYFVLILWFITKENLQNCNYFLCHIHLSTCNNPYKEQNTGIVNRHVSGEIRNCGMARMEQHFEV
jgi:hypothetical protein